MTTWNEYIQQAKIFDEFEDMQFESHTNRYIYKNRIELMRYNDLTRVGVWYRISFIHVDQTLKDPVFYTEELQVALDQFKIWCRALDGTVRSSYKSWVVKLSEELDKLFPGLEQKIRHSKDKDLIAFNEFEVERFQNHTEKNNSHLNYYALKEKGLEIYRWMNFESLQAGMIKVLKENYCTSSWFIHSNYYKLFRAAWHMTGILEPQLEFCLGKFIWKHYTVHNTFDGKYSIVVDGKEVQNFSLASEAVNYITNHPNKPETTLPVKQLVPDTSIPNHLLNLLCWHSTLSTILPDWVIALFDLLAKQYGLYPVQGKFVYEEGLLLDVPALLIQEEENHYSVLFETIGKERTYDSIESLAKALVEGVSFLCQEGESPWCNKQTLEEKLKRELIPASVTQ